jgi:arsenate reductase
MADVVLYGLGSCDTCRKARKELDAAGIAHEFIDLRADADVAKLAPRWIAAVGADALVNRRSTTWRGLSPEERERAETDAGAAALVAEHPTLIKRPVIDAGGEVRVGWTTPVRAALGVA